MGHQLLEPCIRVVQQTAGAVNDFTQIVRWDVGRHTDCDTGGTVDQQVWKTAGQNGRFLQAVIVVGLKIHRFLVDVGEHLHGNFAHLRLGVSVSCRRVAVDRTEVAVTVYQRVTQGKILCQTHQRIVNRSVAVRMVLTQHVTDRVSALTELSLRVQSVSVHGVQDTSVDRFESVSDIRQRTAGNDRHGVIQIRILHLLLNILLNQVFTRCVHLASFLSAPQLLFGTLLIDSRHLFFHQGDKLLGLLRLHHCFGQDVDMVSLIDDGKDLF